MDESTQDIQLDLFYRKDNHSDLQEKVKELEKECDRLRVENSDNRLGQALSKTDTKQQKSAM